MPLARIWASVWGLGLFFALSALGGCTVNMACPGGWHVNATGDCVPGAANGDGDQDTLNPCPEGFILNALGLCVQIPADGDKTESGDTPQDGDSELSGDGDSDGQDIEIPSCSIDTQCEIGKLCHPLNGSGRCLSPCTTDLYCQSILAGSYCAYENRCRAGAKPENCTTDTLCPLGDLCHDKLRDGGLCAPACTTLGDCQKYDLGAYCASDGRCVKGTQPTICTIDGQCPIGTICHSQFQGGICKEPCHYSFDCSNVVADTMCNASQRCIPKNDGMACTSDESCEINTVCHAVLTASGRCLPACTSDANCRELSGLTDVFCNSWARCRPNTAGSGCTSDPECPLDTVCHTEAKAGGVCYAPCDSSAKCRALGENLACNASSLCVPSVISEDGDATDGDTADADDTDGDTAEPDSADNDTGDADTTDADSESRCPTLHAGEVLTVNFNTAKLTLRILRDGAVYVDPSAKSAIYLRDTQTGGQFKLYDKISQGDLLPAVTLIRGTYDVIAMNALSQRATVLTGLVLDGDKTQEISFPQKTLTAKLRKNGAPFPTLSSAHQGLITLFDKNAYRSYTFGRTGTGQNDLSFDVFPGSYDVRFDGYLADDDASAQLASLRLNDTINANKDYVFDIATVFIEGSVKINGATPADDVNGRGSLWLLDPTRGDRFQFLDLGTSGAVSFSREIIAGTYTVAYAPQGEDGLSSAYRLPDTQNFTGDQSAAVINLPLVRLKGEALWGDAVWPDFVNLSRGKLLLVNESTRELLLLSNLAQTGPALFDRLIVPGTYSLRFEGPLQDDAWFLTHTYPSANHRTVWQTGLSVSGDTTQNLHLPIVEVSGAITSNGPPLSGLTLNGDYVTVRRAGTYDDVPILHLGTTPDRTHFTTHLFSGDYDVRYLGSNLMGSFQNYYLYPKVTIGPNVSTLDLPFVARQLKLSVTTAKGTAALNTLIDDGTFDAAEVHAIDKKINSRSLASDTLDDSGRFTFTRPPGFYAFVLRLRKGQTYSEYSLTPAQLVSSCVLDAECGANYGCYNGKCVVNLQQDMTLSYTLDLTPMSIAVTLNDQVFPDATDNQSRGDLILRVDFDYFVLTSVDFNETGPVRTDFAMVPNTYEMNLSMGFSNAYPFSQYADAGCVIVAPQ